MFGTKVKEQMLGGASSAGMGVIMYATCAALGLLAHRAREGSLRLTPPEWRAGLLAGATSGLGFWFFLGAMTLPTIVAYPSSQGVSLLAGVVLISAIFREQLTVLKTVGLSLGLGVFLLAVLRQPIAERLGERLPPAVTVER